VGVKVLGSDVAEIERVGVALERLLSPLHGTRSAFYERNTGGMYVDVVPDRDALARYGLRVADLERDIEAAVGGAAAGFTVEGRNRFSISVRYPQDLRSDVERLRTLPIPVGGASGTGGGGMGGDRSGSLLPASGGPLLAGSMGMGDAAPVRPAAAPAVASDAPSFGWDGSAPARPGAPRFVPLGELADVRIVAGPPMLRDEDGLLAGFVYVDLDPRRDVGGYVREARAVVERALERGELSLAAGTALRWTGQYEELERVTERMKLVIPATLLLVLLLLYAHFRNLAEVLIVLLSVPFALVGSVWLLWLLDYRISTAVWVGVIALVGLAAQTGVVMIVYIDQAYERRRRAGRIRRPSDIAAAHMEGTVLRVRPKIMTVATMLFGLVPLLWATGSGADVMKRIAAPMVGGLVTSAFLTLEIIPVVYTYWRQEQLLWERLASLDPAALGRLRTRSRACGVACAALAAALASSAYVAWPPRLLQATLVLAALAAAAAGVAYLVEHRSAHRHVWPDEAAPRQAA
jgi:Cu(I)/Ag(I) efflux system membrane protein CusA/SilA